MTKQSFRNRTAKKKKKNRYEHKITINFTVGSDNIKIKSKTITNEACMNMIIALGHSFESEQEESEIPVN